MKQLRNSAVINARKIEAPQGASRADVKYKQIIGDNPPRMALPIPSLNANPVYLTGVGKRSKMNFGTVPQNPPIMKQRIPWVVRTEEKHDQSVRRSRGKGEIKRKMPKTLMTRSVPNQ